MQDLTILCGDALDKLKELADASVQCCATSPPYFGLRRYLADDHPMSVHEVGREESPDEYVAKLVAIFYEVKRVLRDDGVLWLNLGDSYAGGGNGGGGAFTMHGGDKNTPLRTGGNRTPTGFKQKDLIGIPWMTAFALRADGWYLRQWIPWVKRNSMPESAEDRPASACELIFLLSKSSHYFYDHEAIKLPASMAFLNDSRWETGSTTENDKLGYEAANAQNPKSPHKMFDKQRGHGRRHDGFNDRWDNMEKEQQCSGWRTTRNSDWFFEGLLSNELGDPLAFVVSPANFKGAHFATWPPALVKPMILAGSRTGDTVLDPFAGSGTTGMVALELGRKATLIELNPTYCEMITRRCDITPGLPL